MLEMTVGVYFQCDFKDSTFLTHVTMGMDVEGMNHIQRLWEQKCRQKDRAAAPDFNVHFFLRLCIQILRDFAS